MLDHFASPRALLRRANHHIDDLERKIRVFIDDKEYTHVVEKDVDGFTNVYKLKFGKSLSTDLPHIIFDAANNARSVLDQTGYIVAQLAGVAKPKSAKFPFGPTEPDMINNAKGGCKDLPPDIRSLFVSFKPYKGGNDALWGLNELANAPKHKLLYPTTVASGAFFKTMTLKNVLHPTPINPTWDSATNELIILRTHPATEVEYNIDLKLTVLLDDVDESLRRQRPVPLLRAMTSQVQNVIDLTDTMCKCIGLGPAATANAGAPVRSQGGTTS